MRRFLSVLFIFILIFSFTPAHAAKKTSTPQLTPLQQATVNIYCRVKLAGTTFLTTGSGVFISDRGVILTNAHVGHYLLLATGEGKSKGTCAVRGGSPAKDLYTASLLYIPSGWVRAYTEAVSDKGENKGTGEDDFALLYVTGTKKGTMPDKFPTVSLADQTTIAALTESTPVTITGYPSEKMDADDVRSKLKILTASSTLTGIRSFERPHPDVFILAPSEAGKSGVSGGPVQAANSLIGIVSTLSGEKEKKLKGLRAISLSYINRAVQKDTMLSLSALYAGDLAARSTLTLSALPKDIRKALETSLRRVR